ncbi:VOC family protein [Riemerella anatipestifer]|uniref:VOC family protein n=1 Tax=Riemerella anatipestifer TaxID=34085 RepID=A0AAP3AN50_RIEAN|nr:VOC family protein [Riemerella anatipestifer]AZZ59661.1 VOC family protein [Riemerella anatipestifer]MBT0550672.1 VOC family protein [Riemerella anatipestifer]MBT0553624.1 VOC family protein [Riemerella anatipestifer]MBT0572169.1 VOC family protein [Riemerella anatipestifer]MCE3024439.1 VOC family protein [Riemerella anatipestifer]
MTTVSIYLNFNGNCEEAFNFYKSVFGGEFTYVGRFGDMPPQEGMPPMSEVDKNKIMHIGLPIGNTVLMGSDTGGEWAPSFQQGNNFSINITPESKEVADKLFNGLSAGGKVTMPMADTFWGAYFGMFTDKFGINWMINFESQNNQ